ncbi:MAG TPA: mycofactocin-associated electron transfer flavoprotein alpha subunit [Acidimicrobiales bacterium]|nr:mycofactocin-associated electron transfer flavoprotein alpha subunit [Acidimicrobiales bacterium]
MIAVALVRGGVLVAGSEETIAEAGGAAVVAGEGAAAAAAELASRASTWDAGHECGELRVLELGVGFRPAEWASAIAPHVGSEAVVLPASPDGRDLAPRLAAILRRPLLAGAVRVTADGASLAWRQGRQIARFRADGPFVATLLPGARSVGVAEPGRTRAVPAVVELESPSPRGQGEGGQGDDGTGDLLRPGAACDPELVEVMAADLAAIDLAEADRIVGAGGGLGGPEQVALLETVAAKLGAPVGATRVVTDAGWLGHDRQIGTTGVSVRPRCYLAFGIAGAAQHIAGLGTPRHVVAVNLDPSCPMMAMADLALVTDARSLVAVLAHRLTEGAWPCPT